MTTSFECSRAGQATGLPFFPDMAGASAAYFDGRDYALELLAYVATVQNLQVVANQRVIVWPLF